MVVCDTVVWENTADRARVGTWPIPSGTARDRERVSESRSEKYTRGLCAAVYTPDCEIRDATSVRVRDSRTTRRLRFYFLCLFLRVLRHSTRRMKQDEHHNVFASPLCFHNNMTAIRTAALLNHDQYHLRSCCYYCCCCCYCYSNVRL